MGEAAAVAAGKTNFDEENLANSAEAVAAVTVPIPFDRPGRAASTAAAPAAAAVAATAAAAVAAEEEDVADAIVVKATAATAAGDIMPSLTACSKPAMLSSSAVMLETVEVGNAGVDLLCEAKMKRAPGLGTEVAVEMAAVAATVATVATAVADRE